jgi:hypothetical protein
MRPSAYASLAPCFVSGERSPVAEVRACLARLDAVAPKLNAFVHVARETALSGAEESERRWLSNAALSAIDGMAIGVKDIIETEDMPDWPGLSHVGGISYPPRCGLRAGPARGGRDHSRQDDDHGVCCNRAPHAGTQSARSRAHRGRIEQRISRGGRCRHPAGGARDAGGRLDPAARELLRLRGFQAHVRRAQPQRIVRSPEPELPWDPGGHPGGCLDGGERDRGARRGRSRISGVERAGRDCAGVTTAPAGDARDSRMAEGERWRTGSIRAGARAPRPAWRRDRGPPQRSKHCRGGGCDRRCSCGDICDLRLGVSLAFGEITPSETA